ncbi:MULTISPECIES: cytochrome c biogenesis CcdA family protein [Rhizobium]|uniref:Cytochrome c biogenesis CcdA family protein n=1 Tax=Rhizobium rhododendri TaxID=2506430 RepID=A0ABY8ILD7_9HYPH|nr:MULTISPECIES: cytochrome c biogenesis CcdA family protein [Rhizobium]MBZ5757976.1 cytochrome c biogenesis CcdA family protein [Rhizobium sp. VS19-DR96]MBZ5765194.1 cytochrome c biogenesis CcdA family protein [Rhizobium sp. VS19-DR129.2]MBZ5772737.1 cytochrome c biogenesis CcdA family protein [Rhizobium sp. VS19-DRK62.2]MBZ5782576.1 cytochrome c biogenesis CcdA family protein [Rhizobium sp. VS19-DR121]MBZ5800024.1 cytochrome c biogenesis CcdA family protein [Rhizobium sp. VS19-DR181]
MSIADISLLSALLAGALSFLSPCVLPLVPPYLCYMAGISVEQFRGGNAVVTDRSQVRGGVLLSALFFTLGFSTVFVALGAGASTIGLMLRQHLDLLAQVGGFIIIVMGLNFLGILRFGLLSREARFQGGGKPATWTGAYIMGLAFAFGWTPCIGPVLGAILGVAASRETVGAGAGLLAVYSLGLAVPFWIAAGFSGAFMGFLARFRRHLGLVEKVMGAFLVLTGLAFMFGFVSQAAIWFQQTFPILMQIG